MPEGPVYKVGAVVVCDMLHGPECLLVRPHPKYPGEVPPFVLPRGSRQYQDTDGTWHDARDHEAAVAHAEALEPLTCTLLREMEEEAGIPPRLLQQADVRELGQRLFASRNKPPYPVHWYVITLTPAMLPKLHPVPSDAIAVRWAALPAIEGMAMHQECSPGYVPVMAEALQTRQQLLRVAF